MRDPRHLLLPARHSERKGRLFIEQAPEKADERERKYSHANGLVPGEQDEHLHFRVRGLRHVRQYKLSNDQYDHDPMH